MFAAVSCIPLLAQSSPEVQKNESCVVAPKIASFNTSGSASDRNSPTFLARCRSVMVAVLRERKGTRKPQKFSNQLENAKTLKPHHVCAVCVKGSQRPVVGANCTKCSSARELTEGDPIIGSLLAYRQAEVHPRLLPHS